MADLTQEFDLDTDWVEITAPASMADGTSYLIDVDNADNNAIVYFADTDTAMPAPTVNGHPITLDQRGKSSSARIYPKRASVFTWMRVNKGAARIVISEIGA